MGFAPGKHDAYWRHDRDVDAGCRRLRDVHRVDDLLLLIEDHELDDLRVPTCRARWPKPASSCIRYPIPDFGVPDDVDAYRVVADDILDRVRERAARRGRLSWWVRADRHGRGSMLRAAGMRPDEAVNRGPGHAPRHDRAPTRRRRSSRTGRG